MLVLPADAIDDELLDVARQWVQLFAESRTAEASSLLAEDKGTTDWPEDRILCTIARFQPTLSCFGEDSPRITSCVDAKVIAEYDDLILDQPAHLVLHWIPSPQTTGTYPGRIGEVLYCLPINGYWSDAAVVFHIKVVPDGIALELHDFLLDDSYFNSQADDS